jgi:hypothetical protein
MDLTEPVFTYLLPLFGITDLGAGSFELGATDDVTAFSVDLDMVGTVHSLTNCYTASFGIMGQKGSRPVRLIWNIVGSDESEGTTPVADMLDFAKPFAFVHTSLTVSGASADTSRPPDRFQIFVDQGLVTEHNNSITLTDATPGDRRAVFITSIPYTSAHDDLHWTLIDDDGGKQSVITLNNGTKTITITMPKGLSEGKVGPITGKGSQIRVPLSFNLFKYDNAGTRTTGLTFAITNT